MNSDKDSLKVAVCKFFADYILVWQAIFKEMTGTGLSLEEKVLIVLREEAEGAALTLSQVEQGLSSRFGYYIYGQRLPTAAVVDVLSMLQGRGDVQTRLSTRAGVDGIWLYQVRESGKLAA